MPDYAQHLTNAITAAAKNAWVAALVPTKKTLSDNPRPVSEILDLRRTFVAGYPRHIETADSAEGH